MPDVAFDVVDFGVAESATAGANVVTVVINGTDLIELVGEYERAMGFSPAGGYGGLVPPSREFEPMTRNFLGAVEGGRRVDKVPVLGCDCGESGCWPLMVQIETDSDRVRWSGFTQPHRSTRDYSGFGPLAFGRAQYESALANLERLLDEEP